MLLLDLLYSIHFAPFRNYPDRGRWAAIFLLSSFLTFTFFGLFCMVLYSFFDFRFLRTLPPIISALFSIVMYAALIFILNKVYIVDQRSTEKVEVPSLVGLLIPILALGAVMFFGYSAYKFG
jgi:hypothetical protein